MKRKLGMLGLVSLISLSLVACSKNDSKNTSYDIDTDTSISSSSGEKLQYEGYVLPDESMIIKDLGEGGVFLLGIEESVVLSNEKTIIIPHILEDGTELTTVGLFKYLDGTDVKTSSDEPVDIIISDGITGISNGAFAGCKNIESVSIPGTISIVGSKSFDKTSLTAVYLEEGIEKINSDAFSNASITEVVIPDSVISIQPRAFANNSITSVTFGKLISVIGEESFAYNKITEYTTHGSGVTIASNAFIGNPCDG